MLELFELFELFEILEDFEESVNEDAVLALSSNSQAW